MTDIDIDALRAAAEAATRPRNGAGGCEHVDEGEWFDRSVCPEPCGSMHFYCDTCGARQDYCANEAEPTDVVALTPAAVLALLDALATAERRLAAVEALADEWEAALDPWDAGSFEAKALRAALGTTAADQTDDEGA